MSVAYVVLEARYYRTPAGVFTPNHTLGYGFFSRYLSVFERVVVLARVARVGGPGQHWASAAGEGVEFHDLPAYAGLAGGLRTLPALLVRLRPALRLGGAYFLRLPGLAGSLAWLLLSRQCIPYALEVVGDPWDALGPGTVDSPLRPAARRLARALLRRQCRSAPAAAYVTRQALQARYPPSRDGFHTQFSTVDLPAAMFAPWERSRPGPAGPWRLVFAGGLYGYKGVDVLIEAAARCIRAGLDLEVEILGDGSLRAELERRAARAGLQGAIHFRGRVADVVPFFDCADLFVLPSRQEGLPRALLEAMARGLPCLASDVGGVGELLPAEDRIPPADAPALAGKICRVLLDRDRLARMSIRNREVARSYSREVLEPRRIEFYRYVKNMSL